MCSAELCCNFLPGSDEDGRDPLCVELEIGCAGDGREGHARQVGGVSANQDPRW
jgi:hypothetical protein